MVQDQVADDRSGEGAKGGGTGGESRREEEPVEQSRQRYITLTIDGDPAAGVPAKHFKTPIDDCAYVEYNPTEVVIKRYLRDKDGKMYKDPSDERQAAYRMEYHPW